MRPWKIKRSDYLLRDKWLNLRADRCETPEGHIVEPYYVIETRDWVHVAAFDPMDRQGTWQARFLHSESGT